MAEASENILELKNITKIFPGVVAIDDISMSVKRGSVHVIVGENGAGKSTLMKMINGLYKPTKGTIYFEGKKMQAINPNQARELGISMIYQELNIIPKMSIAENIYLGREPMKKNKIFIDDKKINRLAGQYLKEQKLDYNLHQKMEEISISQAQIIEIIKAISCNAKLIIMDEPTSAITDKEVDYLFEKIEMLKKQGVTIIYISHKLDELLRIADYISVFRDGKHIKTEHAGWFDKNKIISLMVGRELTDIYPKENIEIGDEVLRVENLSKVGVFGNTNFSVNKGEILGVAGLMGAGRTEIVRAIFGIDSKDTGKIFMNNQEIKINNVSDAINNGIAMVSEDRREFGIVPVGSVKENISLVWLKNSINKISIQQKIEKKNTLSMIKTLGIKTSSMDTLVETLSGGNQQKVVLAKWLIANPKVLILDEPTRGIDVGAKTEIYKLMTELVKQGMAIIMISSEMPELIGMSDRILVVYQGQITGEIGRSEASQTEIMKYATGGKKNV